MLLMDNGVDAFELRFIADGSVARQYPIGISNRLFARQVVFGERGSIVVGGSLDGMIYAFDRKTGKPLDMLQHAASGFVQTVTVRIFIMMLI